MKAGAFVVLSVKAVLAGTNQVELIARNLWTHFSRIWPILGATILCLAHFSLFSLDAFQVSPQLF
jgi:hypothetical protein